MNTAAKLNNADYLGAFLSLLCLVHCLITPLIPAVYYMSTSHHHDILHVVLALVLLPVTILSFGRGYLRHRSATIAGTGIFGWLLLCLGLVTHHYETVLTVIAGCLLVTAHVANLKSCNC